MGSGGLWTEAGWLTASVCALVVYNALDAGALSVRVFVDTVEGSFSVVDDGARCIVTQMKDLHEEYNDWWMQERALRLTN